MSARIRVAPDQSTYGPVLKLDRISSTASGRFVKFHTLSSEKSARTGFYLRAIAGGLFLSGWIQRVIERGTTFKKNLKRGAEKSSAGLMLDGFREYDLELRFVGSTLSKRERVILNTKQFLQPTPERLDLLLNFFPPRLFKMNPSFDHAC